MGRKRNKRMNKKAKKKAVNNVDDMNNNVNENDEKIVDSIKNNMINDNNIIYNLNETNSFLNPFTLGYDKNIQIHNILLEHRSNMYFKYIINTVDRKEDKNPEPIIILRPATHKEASLLDPKYKSVLPAYTGCPCPCVMLVSGKQLLVGLVSRDIAGDNWRNELPTLAQWMIDEDNTMTCKLCGINVIFNNSKYCCRAHEVTDVKGRINSLDEKGWNLKAGIY